MTTTPTTTRLLEISTELRTMFPGGTSMDLRVSAYGPSLTVSNLDSEAEAMDTIASLGAKLTALCFGGYEKSTGRPWSWVSGFISEFNLGVTVHFYGKVEEFPPVLPTTASKERTDAPGGSL